MVEPPSDEELTGFRDRGKMIPVRLAEHLEVVSRWVKFQRPGGLCPRGA